MSCGVTESFELLALIVLAIDCDCVLRYYLSAWIQTIPLAGCLLSVLCAAHSLILAISPMFCGIDGQANIAATAMLACPSFPSNGISVTPSCMPHCTRLELPASIIFSIRLFYELWRMCYAVVFHFIHVSLETFIDSIVISSHKIMKFEYLFD